jgi:hypothetical protein
VESERHQSKARANERCRKRWESESGQRTGATTDGVERHSRAASANLPRTSHVSDAIGLSAYVTANLLYVKLGDRDQFQENRKGRIRA